jgi:hypothetical protein
MDSLLKGLMVAAASARDRSLNEDEMGELDDLQEMDAASPALKAKMQAALGQAQPTDDETPSA